MKKVYLYIIALAFACTQAGAQTISTFDNITLPPDSFKNGSDWSGGFASGNAFFPNHFDTSFGFASWDGFAISNMHDSVTAGYMNQYSAMPAVGYAGSANYAVAYQGFAPIRVRLTGAAQGRQVTGFYITNSTYAYRAMKTGGGFNKKFGGSTGTDPDWFKLTMKGYKNGASADSMINFYLADFRSADSTKDYIVRDWTWINLLPMGNVDSIDFMLSSTDTAGGFMNNPAYFCMDNFTTRDVATGLEAKFDLAEGMTLYPNPASAFVSITGGDGMLTLVDMTGRTVLSANFADGEKVNVDMLHSGIYFVRVETSTGTVSKRLIIE
jgi:hypothetical protein